MIDFYYSEKGRVKPIDQFTSGCWVSVIDPTPAELDYLTDDLGLEEDFVKSALDEEETSRVEKEDDQTLVIVDIPLKTKDDDKATVVYETMPMGIITTDSALITVCIAAYFGIAVFAMFMSTQAHFWFLAVCVGMFQGGVQALSRSWFAKIVPPEKSGEYFGLLDICGKGASFMGTAIVSAVSQVSGDINTGVGMIAILFIVGLVLFRIAVKATPENEQA